MSLCYSIGLKGAIGLPPLLLVLDVMSSWCRSLGVLLLLIGSWSLFTGGVAAQGIAILKLASGVEIEIEVSWSLYCFSIFVEDTISFLFYSICKYIVCA